VQPAVQEDAVQPAVEEKPGETGWIAPEKGRFAEVGEAATKDSDAEFRALIASGEHFTAEDLKGFGKNSRDVLEYATAINAWKKWQASQPPAPTPPVVPDQPLPEVPSPVLPVQPVQPPAPPVQPPVAPGAEPGFNHDEWQATLRSDASGNQYTTYVNKQDPANEISYDEFNKRAGIREEDMIKLDPIESGGWQGGGQPPVQPDEPAVEPDPTDQITLPDGRVMSLSDALTDRF
jgi:hypothetical protein